MGGIADTLDEALVKLPVRVADTSAKLCSQRCGRSLVGQIGNERSVMVFQLKSPAFGNAEPIPRKYTADGENLSPPLEWFDPPPGTKSFALIVEDPDAPSGVFRHWGIVIAHASTA
jgi:hypothetical protein